MNAVAHLRTVDPPQPDVAHVFGATKAGKGWKARCPAHDDRVASLSIAERDGGGWVVHCHAGCSTDAVLASAGLAMGDLMPARAANASIVATYDYRDERGQLLCQQVRLEPKSFRSRRPDGTGWQWSLGDVRRVLYRLPELVETGDSPDPVFVTEGEKDADTLAAHGATATTNLGGAGKWRDEYAEALRGRYVVILPDNDEPGRAHALEVARSLQGKAAFVKVLPLSGLPPKGDVTDWIAAGGTLGALCRLASDAPEWSETPSESAPVATTPADFPPSWQLLDDVQVMALADPEYLVGGIIPRRGVGSAYGPSGTGKTTFSAQLMTAIATGADFFGQRVHHRGACVYVATEDVCGFKVRLRSAKVAARLSLDLPIGVYTFPEPIDLRDAVSVERFVRFVRAVQLSMPLELIVLDTYSASMPGASETSSEDTTTAMAHAARWRDALSTTVLMIHHTNASGSRERGHSSMRGACDFMISLTAVDDAIYVESSKQRNGPPFTPFTLKLVPLPEGGCVLRPASDVIQTANLTPQQQKALAILRDNFLADGATKSEWQRSCQDIPERTFHRLAKVLVERGAVKQVGSHFRVVEDYR